LNLIIDRVAIARHELAMNSFQGDAS